MSQQSSNGSGFGALLDFKFESFLALKMIRALYALCFGALALAGGIVVVAALWKGVAQGLGMLVVVGVGFILVMMYTRVVLEVLAVIFRIAEDTRALRERSSAPDGVGGRLLPPGA